MIVPFTEKVALVVKIVIKISPIFIGDIGDAVQFLGQQDLWKRKWQPVPVFLSRKSYGQKSLMDYSPWGFKKSGTSEVTHRHTHAHTHTQSKAKACDNVIFGWSVFTSSLLNVLRLRGLSHPLGNVIWTTGFIVQKCKDGVLLTGLKNDFSSRFEFI